MKINDAFSKFDKPDVGLLILRVITGAYIAANGVYLLQGGTDTYQWLGQQLSAFGLTYAPTLWGFLAAFIQAIGGLMMIFGFLFRPVQLLLFIVMIVATVYHVNQGDDLLKVTALSGIMATIFLSLLFMGPGKYSVDK
jgi:putative oxidoreductase